MRFWRNAYRAGSEGEEASRKSIVSSVERFVPARPTRNVAKIKKKKKKKRRKKEWKKNDKKNIKK